MEELKKNCSKCGAEKELIGFCKNKNKKDGFHSICKDCMKENRIKYRQSELGKKKEKEYAEAHDRTEYHKKYYLDNVEAVKQKNKKHYQNNKQSYFDRSNKNQKRRRKEDPTFKMKQNVSRAIRLYLKKNNSINNGRIFSFLPYTPSDLKKHLETLWEPEMSWENYGTYWEIDHKIPQSKLLFDSFVHPNFLKCWDLRNLQPLSIKKNLKKGDKLLYSPEEVFGENE